MGNFKKTTLFALFLVGISTSVWAKEIPFTIEDRDRLIRLEATVKEFKDSMDDFKKSVGNQFEQVNRQFEQVYKQFEPLYKQFGQVDIRFVELREDMNKRFDQMMTFMWMLVVVFMGVTGVTIGFALWDRKTMIRPFEEKTKQMEEKIKDMDEKKLANLINTLREIAKGDSQVAEALKKFNLL